MKGHGDHACLEKFRQKHPESLRSNATILLILQFILILLLFATAVLVCLVDTGGRLVFYLLLLGGLLPPLLAGLFCNTNGKYLTAAIITSACTIVGPWVAIVFDPQILRGDIIPFVYVGLSIQLCAILLAGRATLIISVVQLAGVLTAILLSPQLSGQNWPSLFAFIVFTAAIGVSAGYTNRKQLDQIERQHVQLLKSEALLRDLSLHDSLTGLYNRRYMEESFDRELERVRRKESSLAVVMIDVDHFKVINDTYGHVIGDSVLKYIADFLSGSVRGSDIACRYGGDEFVLILPECSRGEAAERAESMRTAFLSAEVRLPEQIISKPTLSFGVSALPEDGATREALISAADAALYAAKQAGRNRVAY